VKTFTSAGNPGAQFLGVMTRGLAPRGGLP